MWADLSKLSMSANALLQKAQEKHVIFVPGDSFYTDETDTSTLRLNFTNSSLEVIDNGMRILGELMHTATSL